MQTITETTTKPAWTQAILSPPKEFPLTHLEILSGKIPLGIRGTLYRNGPAKLERNGERVGHWFDGDGAILAVHFHENKVTATYRYVQTKGYLKETQENRFIYPNYGMTAAGWFGNNLLKPVKNTANTSVLPLPTKLLALWEGGNPHALDLEDLTTFGTDSLSKLAPGESFSAHPKIDPNTGEIYNFGLVAGRNAKLNIYKSDPTGNIVQKKTFQLNGIPLIHEFVFAGKYLIFFVSPVRVNLVSVIFGNNSYSDSLTWKPELGTEILVIDRENLSLVSRSQTDPWFQWHFANGYVDKEGFVVTEIVQYPDFKTNQYLQEVASGKTKTFAPGTLWQIRLNPQSGKVVSREQLLERSCEFPVVKASQVGKPWRYTYLSLHREGVDISRELLGAIARFDHKTNHLSIADPGKNRYPSELIYVPDSNNSELGWLLTVVYDGNTHTSEVWLYDSDRLEDPPVCRLGLPSVIPLSFHGAWKPA
ncbi:MAG: carotenoid oxygenase family protein [Oscillatoria sp. PMC 1068.18]|nr:carotenoid oxygenase family protein [Oscillatoria sp. PMC 1076.18]MEC4987207.1 carotenoid oxygenase family protein [Oscillatoria sp. PMC 1068.18]